MTPVNRQRGMSLIELLAVTGIAGALGVGALGALRLPSPALAVASQEIQGALEQALSLARNSGHPVEVSASTTKDIGHLPVNLPRSIHWGLPEGVPLPPHMDPTLTAAATGEAHKAITVTPRHTATATVWFLNDGEDALCVRVNDHGRSTVLRWSANRHRWARS